ncbi:MAG: tyrosine-type recombinase/integrase [Kofleriaceae bacterium]
MASIYARGNVLWIKYKNEHGKPACRSSGYRVGQEAVAQALAVEVEEQAAIKRAANANAPIESAPPPPVAASPPRLVSVPASKPIPSELSRGEELSGTTVVPERIGPAAAPGALTVADYIEQWIKMRWQVETWKDEAGRLRLHVVPLIGHMAIADVRPKHIRDLINAIKAKTSDAPKCKNKPLAPRTVRLIFGALRLVFKSAIIDEHISSSPIVVEAGVLPKNVDKDPAWRSTAIFERDELIAILSDPRIALYHRVIYALEGLAGVRHGEAAALRWSDRNTSVRPLGKLTVSKSGKKNRTKTQITREVPIHPALAAILAEWETTGWAAMFGRAPKPTDLIVPSERNKIRSAPRTLKKFHQDLEVIGLRTRRGHDLRRTFVTLIRVDGGRSEVLRPITHPGEKDIIGLYTTFPWPVVCGELAKLRIELPTHETIEADQTTTITDEKIAADEPATVASYTSDCSSEIASDDHTLHAVAEGERFRKP